MAETRIQDVAELTRIPLGLVRVACPGCGMLNGMLSVGMHTRLVLDEIVMLGAISYSDCGCLFMCRHLSTRVAVLLENYEQNTLTMEDFCHLVEADHGGD